MEQPPPFSEAWVRVRYAETDQMGVVYHANYLVWMEIGRVEYCRSAGLRYKDFEREAELQLAVVEVQCRYRSPARYDEQIVIRTSVGESNPRLVRFDYEIRNAENAQALAAGFTRHIFLGRDGKPKKLPEKYRGIFGMRGAHS
jgi:acyl-CoA thioester hydrolase